jgi:hypothetical protein
MRSEIITAGIAARDGARTIRVVLLPGAYHALEEFRGAGFDQALRDRALSLELILAAPELAHLSDRRWLRELQNEIISPARERGGELWLGGISLGGFMALRFAAEADGEGAAALDGLCLLAPYLGSRIVAAEVAAQGLALWRAGALSDDDDERRVWRFVQRLPTMPHAPSVFLGLGSEDRFADTQRLLAAALPAGSTLTLAGGHDWPVWRALWDRFLDRFDSNSIAEHDRLVTAPSRSLATRAAAGRIGAMACRRAARDAAAAALVAVDAGGGNRQSAAAHRARIVAAQRRPGR